MLLIDKNIPIKKYIMVAWFITIACNAFAGWPVGKGRYILGVGYSVSYGNRAFDNNGVVKKLSINDDYFRSTYLSFYFARGISRRFDFVATIPYIIQKSVSNGVATKQYGWGNAMAGFAYSIENYDYTKYLTFQTQGIFPLHTGSGDQSLIGYGRYGIDFTLNYVFIPKALTNKGYITLEGSYRHYFAEEGPNQFLWKAAYARIYDHYNQIVISADGIKSYSSNSTQSLSPSSTNDYSLAKLSFTYGRRIYRTSTLFGSVFYTVLGRNVLQGYGFGLNLITKLP